MLDKHTIFFRRGAHFLAAIKDKRTSVTLVCKKSDTTWSHGSQLITCFEKQGIITKQKIGRTNIICLTPKGKILADCITKFQKELGD